MLRFTTACPYWVRWLICFGLSLCWVLLSGGQWLTIQQPAMAMESEAWVQQGIDRYQTGDYQGAIGPWKAALEHYQTTNHPTQTAIVLENLARAAQQLGRSSEAGQYWAQAIAIYKTLEQPQQLNRALTEQAQTYSNLGQPRRALALLCGAPIWAEFPTGPRSTCPQGTALAIAQLSNDHLGQIAARGSLAEAYRLLGEYDAAQMHLAQATALIQQTEGTTADYAALELGVVSSQGTIAITQAQIQYRKAATTERMGDTIIAQQILAQARQMDQVATQRLESALQLAIDQANGLAQLKLQISLIPTYRRLGRTAEAELAQVQAIELLNQLPPSQDKAFATLHLAQLSSPQSLDISDIPSGHQACQVQSDTGKTLLGQGLEIARQINNHRTESFALGQLGHLAECQQNYSQALTLTRQAQLVVQQSSQAKDSAYLWDWQAGRILQQLGQTQQATQAYQQAVTQLEAIRGDILTSSSAIQFDFRDTVEPIYRELAALTLTPTSGQSSTEQGSTEPSSATQEPAEITPKQIQTTLETVDSLKLAELQNYFGNDCLIEPTNQAITQLGQTGVAIANTLIFEDHLAVIYSFPSGEKQVEWIPISADRLRNVTLQFRRQLEWYQRADEYSPALGQQMYDWLIKPFESRLGQEQIKTLVFINDGVLRSVPMAALHNGQQYLIQRYAIATTPSLRLTDPAPLKGGARLKVLAMGLTEESAGFVALPFVHQEVKAVQQQFPKTKALLNKAFSRRQLQTEFTASRYPIVHIATHGQFGTEPEDNFLVTGNDEKITISELDQLIREASPMTEPIELLVLTACQTAIGDDRAALGLAGVALRAGARSAIASLWSINDESTAQVMDKFYSQLSSAMVSKAEALQAAQIALIEEGGETAHPARWAPYILIGNWL